MIGRGSALALLGAAVATPGAAFAADAPATIRIAYMTTDAFAQGLYADAGGFFKAAGLNVELVMLGNSGSIAAAVAGGSVDIGLGNPISLANAVESGLPFYAIAPSALFVDSKPQSFMVVAKTSAVQSAKDLAGKTIGLVEFAASPKPRRQRGCERPASIPSRPSTSKCRSRPWARRLQPAASTLLSSPTPR